jgi:hypothetical protein
MEAASVSARKFHHQLVYAYLLLISRGMEGAGVTDVSLKDGSNSDSAHQCSLIPTVSSLSFRGRTRFAHSTLLPHRLDRPFGREDYEWPVPRLWNLSKAG